MKVVTKIEINMVIDNGYCDAYCATTLLADDLNVEPNGSITFYAGGKRIFNTGMNRIEEGERDWVHARNSDTVTLYAEYNCYI